MDRSRKLQLAAEMRSSPTIAKQKMAELLRAEFPYLQFSTQHLLVGYIVDVFCPKLRLVLELDGSIHQGRKLQDAIRADNIRRDAGVALLRFRNDQIINRPHLVVAKLRQYLCNN
jgi:very-short-patch-repair endonuclease